jgi:hypothetical protein
VSAKHPVPKCVDGPFRGQCTVKITERYGRNLFIRTDLSLDQSLHTVLRTRNIYYQTELKLSSIEDFPLIVELHVTPKGSLPVVDESKVSGAREVSVSYYVLNIFI